MSVAQHTNTVMFTCTAHTHKSSSTSALNIMHNDNNCAACFYYLAHGTDGSVTVTTINDTHQTILSTFHQY